MDNRYVFDKDNFDVRKQKSSAGQYVRKLISFFLLSLVLAILYYVIFAIFFSTDTEKQFQTENRTYQNEFSALESKEALLKASVEELQLRDDAIYGQIFQTTPPDLDMDNISNSTMTYSLMTDSELIMNSMSRLNSLEFTANSIEEAFREIALALSDSTKVLPPMSLPLEQVSYTQVGASIGERINPFYKVGVSHKGLDIISDPGENVLATADGVVTYVVRSRRGDGNVVEITHDGGYITRYKHLEDIKTYRGRKVKKGSIIGHVGVSGHVFAPHLHYELLKDTVYLDPINHIFASVNPDEYLEMLIMSTATKQSMD